MFQGVEPGMCRALFALRTWK